MPSTTPPGAPTEAAAPASSHTHTRVGVIGLGPMGAPIAANLLAAGVPLSIWNRTTAKAESLVAGGATLAPSPADLDVDVVLSILPDVPQLDPLLDDATLTAWGARGTRLVVMSTTSPQRITELAARLASFGVRVLDAPMSGGDKGAREATLSIMVGGTEEDWAAVRPVLDVLGTTVVRCGDLGAGALAKLCNQVVVAGTLAVLAEAIGVATKAGLDIPTFTRILGGGLASSAVLSLKRDKLISREYSLGGSTANQVKDLDYALSAAAEVHALTPLTDVLAELYRSAAVGHAQDDHSAILEGYLAD